MNRYVGLLLVVLAVAGCNSIRTTVLDRTENGNLVCGNHSGHLKGVPVMVKVPTHIEVRIYQRDYWYANVENKLVPLEQQMATRFVDTKVQMTEQMFLVDPKRPAAGTGVYAFKFNSSADDKDAGKGYLKSVAYQANDETLTRSATLLTSIAGLIGPPSTTLASKTSSNGRKRTKDDAVLPYSTDRLVKMMRFDINSPTVDDDIREFLDTHLNNCHNCL